jgi:hypothetical protein
MTARSRVSQHANCHIIRSQMLVPFPFSTICHVARTYTARHTKLATLTTAMPSASASGTSTLILFVWLGRILAGRWRELAARWRKRVL